MAEALAIEGAKWVASTIVTGLLKEGFSYLGVDISTKLQELETTILPQFQLVIEAAERSTEHKAKLQSWLKDLKDAVYEAEDVLDLYRYQLLEEVVADLNNPAVKPFVLTVDCTTFLRLHCCWHNLFGRLNPFMEVARNVNAMLSIFSPQKIMLRISLNKLEKIAAEAKEFHKLLRVVNDGTSLLLRAEQPNVTTSLLPTTVIGRDKERDEIIDKYLLDSSEASEPRKSYSVVSIVGMGGAGKTTLAQLVYNDKRVDEHFDVKMWVCVFRTLDVNRHTREMIESAFKNKCPRIENLDALQGKLINLIKSKKLLLILDDVWYDNSKDESNWETLLAPLANAGKSGSKVLVTTRTTILPVTLRPQYIMVLKDLEDDHILSLFKIHAFPSTKLDGSLYKIYALQDELMIIGKQIVQKLHGSPLAAKAVGSRLGNTLNVGAWKEALDGDNLRDSQQALLWSYQRLDAPLQRCFSYFSLFPKGHKYEAKKMVQLWIAEGFINSSNNSKRMEDIGMEYFDELVSASFLQKYRKFNEEYYNMHDLFHDLAENVSKEDCLRIEAGDQVKEIPPTIRRLSIRGYVVKVNNISFNKLENLHTLMIEAGSTANLFTATEKCNKKLRVLMIEDFVSRGTLTKLMANLKYLRFLYFKWNEEGEIPAAVGKLYHLQVLNLPYNASLPRSLKNLINLRYFEGDKKALTSLPDLGRLTSLQKLEIFVVKGHDIGQLKNLNELRESLTISNLENVEDKASEANLKAKRHLESLHLRWDSNDEIDCKRDLDMKVLEGLQPHSNLTKLTIEGYKSHMYPSNWLPVDDLRSLKLHKCTALEVLPPICNLFPHCSELEILELSKLRRFTSLPQHLKKLVIINCPSLIFISEEEVQKKSIMTAMQSYQLLNRELKADEVARDCLEVKRLLESEKVDVPEDFTTLATTLQSCEERVDDLDLQKAYYHCQEQRLEVIFGRREKSELILPSSLQILILDHCNITDGAFSQSLQGLTSLKSLELYNISALTTLPAEKVLHHLIALTELEIGGCHWLKSLGGLYALPSLEKLWINTCPCLELEMVTPLPLPSSLQTLILDHCNITDGALSQSLQGLTSLKSFMLNNISALTTLPAEEVLHHLIALTELKIDGCHWLKSLGGLYALPSLEELEIRSCPCLELEMVMPLQGERGGSCILPPSLRSLSIRECTTMMSIVLIAGDGNPPNLATLSVKKCPSLAFMSLSHQTALTNLIIIDCRGLSSLLLNCLESLNRLHLNNCRSISSLPKHLPQSLNHLNLQNCRSISSLPKHLPQSLNSLNLQNCRSISSLPKHLPQSLRELKLWNCPSISSLPEHLPQSLNSLRVSSIPFWAKHCFYPSIFSLPKHMPQSLRELELWNCPSISSLPEHLSQSLRELHLTNCPNISSLPEHLPQSLSTLHLDNCPNISYLPEHLPQSLSTLHLQNSHSISSLPKHLPQSLNSLQLSNCHSISYLPEHLPQSLRELHLTYCPSISSLPEHLPQSLSTLHLTHFPSISSLPEHLPQSLSTLHLTHCPIISSLPEHLPQSLRKLHLTNCPSISSLREHLPQSLEFISIRGCQNLEERCRSPNGEDWPKIAHIPRRDIFWR